MSSISDQLSLPYIQAGQAQKHVTHNEALRALDNLVLLHVVRGDLTDPPAQAEQGDRYIVASGATGAWDGQDHAIAVSDNGGWLMYAPQAGWIAWDHNTQAQLVFDGAAWGPVMSDPIRLDTLGINTDADAVNRFSVAGDATLLSHAGNGHQLKINKAAAGDTATLLFQSAWSGHAEMGLAGSNDFAIKASPDGTTFHTALQVDHQTGEVSFPSGVTGLKDETFGTGPLLTTDYSAAKGQDLVVNGTGLLGNAYNMPPEFEFVGSNTPNLPGAFRFPGYGPHYYELSEFLGVNPNSVYRASLFVLQEGLDGDWSSYAHGDRHRQFVGLSCFDVDKNPISAVHHMRYKSSGVDSMTQLTAPLSPGDTVVSVADASGWNDTDTPFYQRGIIMFGYKNSQGALYDYYSRLAQYDLFDLSGVDKSTGTITLKAPFPATLGNPDDPNGTWPVGTSLANSNSGGTYKYSILPGLAMAQSDTWYQVVNHMGGVDLSGTNVTSNFAPGTAYVKLFWLPNFSNRPGGSGGYPDTGADHGVLFSGVSLTQEALAATAVQPSGAVAIKVPHSDFNSASLSLRSQGVVVSEL